MAGTLSITLSGGPYDGQTHVGTIDDDVGAPTEFSLFVAEHQLQYIYRENEAGVWAYVGFRTTTAFVSVQPIDQVFLGINPDSGAHAAD